jgi:hypothetical protein
MPPAMPSSKIILNILGATGLSKKWGEGELETMDPHCELTWSRACGSIGCKTKSEVDTIAPIWNQLLTIGIYGLIDAPLYFMVKNKAGPNGKCIGFAKLPFQRILKEGAGAGNTAFKMALEMQNKAGKPAGVLNLRFQAVVHAISIKVRHATGIKCEGKVEPYCSVHILGSRFGNNTGGRGDPDLEGQDNPEWNKDFLFIHDGEREEVVKIGVWNAKANCGEIRLKLAQFKPGTSYTRTYALNDDGAAAFGTVEVTFQMTQVTAAFTRGEMKLANQKVQLELEQKEQDMGVEMEGHEKAKKGKVILEKAVKQRMAFIFQPPGLPAPLESLPSPRSAVRDNQLHEDEVRAAFMVIARKFDLTVAPRDMLSIMAELDMDPTLIEDEVASLEAQVGPEAGKDGTRVKFATFVGLFNRTLLKMDSCQWVQYYDVGRNQFYFADKQGRCQWQQPDNVTRLSVKIEDVELPASKRSQWEEVEDEHYDPLLLPLDDEDRVLGRSLWVNEHTGEFRWKPPPADDDDQSDGGDVKPGKRRDPKKVWREFEQHGEQLVEMGTQGTRGFSEYCVWMCNDDGGDYEDSGEMDTRPFWKMIAKMAIKLTEKQIVELQRRVELKEMVDEGRVDVDAFMLDFAQWVRELTMDACNNFPSPDEWCHLHNEDERKFWYNKRTREQSWESPFGDADEEVD